jgi:hypothetical protein
LPLPQGETARGLRFSARKKRFDAIVIDGIYAFSGPGIARAEHTKLFWLSKLGTLNSAVSGVCPPGSTKLSLAVADSVSATQASAEITADGNVRQQDKVNGSDWIDIASLDARDSYLIFFSEWCIQQSCELRGNQCRSQQRRPYFVAPDCR